LKGADELGRKALLSGQAIATPMAKPGLGKNKVEEGNYFALCRWLTDSLYPLFFPTRWKTN
jgi:hypothetical protein